MAHRVLIVTGPAAVGGSMVRAQGNSLVDALRRQIGVLRASSSVWLDLSLKAVSAELLAAKTLFLRSGTFHRAPYRGTVERYMDAPSYFDSPELTEVVLAGLLAEGGIDFTVTTFAELSVPERVESLLESTDCVFVSSTLMRDLSELLPLVDQLKRPHNRIVVGGALVSLLHHLWPGHPGIDVVAVGYGELLVPALVNWIAGDFGTLDAPDGGRVVERNGNLLLFSGNPEGKSLDWLPTPDWSLAERYHGRSFELVHYESVRGCPYRCAFCNYPFLFDDTVFRTKSAQRIAHDWLAYAERGAKIVNCLDSLFTIPPQRLSELCDHLIAAGSPIGWICYARAGDLARPGTAEHMKRAGCRVVHVGYESGSQVILENMNKRSGVDSNVEGLRRCREVGLTTVATLIVGFPGETDASIEETVARLNESPPDVFFAGGFNTRMEAMPVLQPESRARFGLVTQNDQRSSAPYWRHTTMACDRVPGLVRHLNHTLIENRVALEGSLFYAGLLGFEPSDRSALLDFQHDLFSSARWLRAGGRLAQEALGACLRADLRRKLPQPDIAA